MPSDDDRPFIVLTETRFSFRCIPIHRRPGGLPWTAHDDDPFIVLTETKFSFRCIPVWIGTLL